MKFLLMSMFIVALIPNLSHSLDDTEVISRVEEKVCFEACEDYLPVPTVSLMRLCVEACLKRIECREVGIDRYQCRDKGK